MYREKTEQDVTKLDDGRKNDKNLTARYVLGKRGCRGSREHSVNEAQTTKMVA